MRGCEHGAGAVDTPGYGGEPTAGHSGHTTRWHTKQAVLNHSVDTATAHNGQTIYSYGGEAIYSCSEEAILRQNREGITCHVEDTFPIHCKIPIKQENFSKEAISRCNKEPILNDIENHIKAHKHRKLIALDSHCEETINSSKHSLCNVEEIHLLHRRRKAITKNSEEAILRHRREAILPRKTRGGAILLCMLLLLMLRGSRGSASLGAQLVCARAPLTEKQRALCRASPAAMAAIATGLRMAYAECRLQMSGRRWNCSGVGDHTHFGHVMPLATREAAYTYGITSAGVTHALSAACARGDLPACGCAHSRRRSVPSDQWEWSGAGAARCGETAYGARLARRFLDARELERDARAVMNLHNNRLGRKMVKELVRRECKCHGVSGSCAVRTCWRALPPFRALGAALTDKYRRARLVSPIERGTSADGRVNIQLVVKRARHSGGASGAGARPARRNELVYLAPSPSYCEPEPAAGALGTHARVCNHTSTGENGCESLCCGRGYSTVRRTERVQCRCQFEWCCRVRCQSCLTRTELHVCN